MKKKTERSKLGNAKKKYTGLELVLMARIVLIRYMVRNKLKTFEGIKLSEVM